MGIASGMLAMAFTAGGTLIHPPVDACQERFSVLGWTQDSRWFVYREETRCVTHSRVRGAGAGSRVQSTAFVLDTGSGKVARFRLRGNAGWPAGTRALPGPAAFAAWSKAHPLAPLRGGALSPRGSRRRMLVGRSGKDLSTNGDFDDHGNLSRSLGPESPIAFVVASRHKVWKSDGWTARGHHERVSGYWSPEGLRVFWDHRWHSPDAGREGHAWHVQSTSPDLELLAAPDLPEPALARARAALEREGTPPVSARRHGAARARTIVYAAPGMMRQAKRVARALPGGARIERLSGKAGFDLVVALGKTAR